MKHQDDEDVQAIRELAQRTFSRIAGTPVVSGNYVRLLRDATENYPAWLEAINGAKERVHFESYIIHEDEIGNQFADALMTKARQGVHVRVIYDWMGALGNTSSRFWRRLRRNGVEVRCYNPPRFGSPFGWLSRDHRKILVIDGRVGFIAGLCVGKMWVGYPEKNIPPWRDTGIELRGPAVADVERAFGHTWAMLGTAIPETELTRYDEHIGSDGINVRVVASMPATAGMIRMDQFVAALARKRLWLSDAYYGGTTSYVEALRAAARDGVDVRLLLPNATDIPLLQPISRSGYRALLESGVRVFEWNGSMMHAKTAVADTSWARVGSTNLNIASWFGNCELDAVIEDESFAREMEDMFLQDLTNATEIVLDAKQKVRAPHELPRSFARSGAGGSAGRAAAGAVRITNAIGAAFTNRRELGPVEARLMVLVAVLLLGLALLFGYFPRVLAAPTVVLFGWIAAALFYRACQLYQQRKRR